MPSRSAAAGHWLQMRHASPYGQAATMVVAAVWLTHGLYNKLLGGSPRHLAIVQAVPGFEGATGEHLLAGVGVLEVVFAVWVLSARAPLLCAGMQTVTLLSMNVVELTFARHLLLWPEGLIPVNLLFLALAWKAAAAAHEGRADRQAALTDPERRPVRADLRTRMRRHPIAVEARFDHCLALTYAVPVERLRPFVPPGLEPDTRNGLGFFAVALVQTRSLRPAGLPRWLGHDFFLAGYRVFTRFTTSDGRTLRGLRIVRSDANRAAMVMGGNLLTHYHYHRCEAALVRRGPRMAVRVRTRDRGADLHLDAYLDDPSLPADSPFTTDREARRFAGPMPFTFDYEPQTDGIVIVGSRRANWTPVLVRVDVHRLSFFDDPAFTGCQPMLAAAFHLQDVDYRWERGVWQPAGRTKGGGPC